jgi:hypothetical protein
MNPRPVSREIGSTLGSVDRREEGASSVKSDKAPSNNHLRNSRGGTRTLDPGIMSAVL